MPRSLTLTLTLPALCHYALSIFSLCLSPESQWTRRSRILELCHCPCNPLFTLVSGRKDQRGGQRSSFSTLSFLPFSDSKRNTFVRHFRPRSGFIVLPFDGYVHTFACISTSRRSCTVQFVTRLRSIAAAASANGIYGTGSSAPRCIRRVLRVAHRRRSREGNREA